MSSINSFRPDSEPIGREYWIDDSSATKCFLCEKNFTFFRRKHHCRVCGQVFCFECCRKPQFRVCLSCLASFATDSDLESPPPKMANEIPSTHLVQRSNSYRVRRPRFSQSSHNVRSGLIVPVDDSTSNIDQHNYSSSNLSPLFHESNSTRIGSPSHKSPQTNPRLNLFDNSDNESEDEKSMSLYEALHSSNNINTSSSNYDLVDFSNGNQDRYNKGSSSEIRRNDSRARLSRMNSQTRSERAQASLWRMKNRMRSKTVSKIPSGSQPYFNGIHRSKTDIDEDTFKNMVDNNKKTAFDFNGVVQKHLASTMANGNSTSNEIVKTNISDNNKRVFSLPNKDLRVFMELHASRLLKQALEDEGLDGIQRWQDVLFKTLKRVGDITPDIRGGESFDIRQYVKLKRIPGSTIEDSAFVDGIIFSKNVALKSMARELNNPQICIVMFPIEYTKTEQHFMSLELVLAQEKESLHKLVSRIVALNPDILLIGASISGIALEMLDNAGIIVVNNIKPQVIERISKMTDADVVTSIDQLAVDPKLGTCDLFEVKQYVYQGYKRSYIILSGCNTSNGGTILLRGADQLVLRKVKSTIEFLIYVFFNLNLECSLFRDEYLTVVDLDSENKRELDSFQSTYHADFIEKLKNRYLSSSAVIRFYMPPLLYKAREADEKLSIAIRELEDLRNSSAGVTTGKLTVHELDENNNQISKVNEIDSDLDKSVEMKNISVKDKDEFKIAEFILERKIESLKISLQGWQRQWELFYSHSPYLLEPTSHQSLLFLYTMVNSKTTAPCVGPETLGIDYYWMSDISLGQYIEHISITANGECPEGCGNNLIDHYRSYVHGNGKVDVIVEQFQSRIPGLQNSILMWSYCKDCRQSTPVIPMTENTWKYSFGKYLELSFWSDNVTLIGTCPHDFKNHIRYFGIYNLAVRMEYSKVENLELVVPKFKLYWKPDIDIKLKIELVGNVRTKSAAFFDSIWERLNRVKVDSMTIDKMEAGQKRIEELKQKVSSEKEKIIKMTDDIYENTKVVEHLPLNSVIRNIQELSVEWDMEFQDFEIKFLPSEKDITRITSSQLRKLFMDKETIEENRDDDDDDDLSQKSEIPDIEERLSEKLEESKSNEVIENGSNGRNSKMAIGPNVSEKISKMQAMLGEDYEPRPDLSPTKQKFPLSSKIPVRSFSEVSPKFHKPGLLESNELELELRRGRPQRSNSNGKVKQLTTLFDQLHFDQISREFELQRERERRKLIANRYRAIPVIASKPIVEVYKNVHDAVEEELSDDESKSTTTVSALRRKQFSVINEEIGEDTLKKDFSEKKEEKKEELKKAVTTDIPQTERASLMKTLTSFWADRSAALWKPLAYPLTSTEHIFVDSDVIVREDEPSSLIAFCLSSSDYVTKLKAMRETTVTVGNSDTSSMAPPPPPTGDNATGSEIHIETTSELEKIMLKKTAIHLKYQFQEGSSLLSCKIFFAEQFDAFRQQCGIDENFVQSLSRCIKWDSTGGKSGSAFLKTLDDRFIIKELSHSELDAFVKFAPSYFEYLAQALFHDLPTVLAKIFGFYQIYIKNPIDNKHIKLDLLIMENLFYDRKTSRIFDLKGSMRNRHVEQTGKENEVLLDENMIEYIYESPLFVKEYAKKLLRTSLWNDTLFLSRMNVMDYSLVIGIDSENHELVVGIIDCIRTFTWDKKLESWVKEKGLVGGGGKEPTVVTPRQYKNRFRDAMDRYILMVPDCWNQGPIE